MSSMNLLSISTIEEQLTTIRPKRASIEDDLVTQQLRRKQQKPVSVPQLSKFNLVLCPSEDQIQADEPSSPYLNVCNRKESDSSCFTFTSPTPLAIEPVSSYVPPTTTIKQEMCNSFSNFLSFGEICVEEPIACVASYNQSTDVSFVRESNERLLRYQLEQCERNSEQSCKRNFCADVVIACSNSENKKLKGVESAKQRLFRMVSNLTTSS